MSKLLRTLLLLLLITTLLLALLPLVAAAQHMPHQPASFAGNTSSLVQATGEPARTVRV